MRKNGTFLSLGTNRDLRERAKNGRASQEQNNPEKNNRSGSVCEKHDMSHQMKNVDLISTVGSGM